jgi:hypothetical protein
VLYSNLNNAEYSTAANYEIDLSDCADEYEERDAVKEYLNDKGYGFCGITEEETIIYQQF